MNGPYIEDRAKAKLSMAGIVCKVCPKTEDLSAESKGAQDYKIARRKKFHHVCSMGSNNQGNRVVHHYHCPASGCVYSSNSERHFPCFKYLRQHYMKVHAVKAFACETCEKRFSRMFDLTAHQVVCGKIFTCSCGQQYSTRDALLTHAHRKNHELPSDLQTHSRLEKTKGPIQLKATLQSNNPSTVLLIMNTLPEPTISNVATAANLDCRSYDHLMKPRFILPKSAPINALPSRTVAALALSELGNTNLSPCQSSIATQTESSVTFLANCHCKPVKERMGYGIKRRNQSCQTHLRQLGEMKTKKVRKLHANSETQTLEKLQVHVKSRHTIQKQWRTAIPCTFRPMLCQNVDKKTQTWSTSLVEDSLGSLDGLASDCLDVFGLRNSREPKRCHSDDIVAQTLPGMDLWRLDASHTSPEDLPSNDHGSLSGLDVNVNYPISAINSCGTQTSPRVCNQCTGMLCQSFYIDESFRHLQSMEGDLASALQTCADGTSQTAVSSFVDKTLMISGMASTCAEGFYMTIEGDDHAAMVHHLSSETQTELESRCLFSEDQKNVESDDSILFADIQTQTTGDLDSITYDQLLTNMETQTSEDFLFSDLTFSNIKNQVSCGNNAMCVNMHTQTKVEPYWKSLAQSYINSETQTLLSQLDCSDSFTDSHTQTQWH